MSVSEMERRQHRDGTVTLEDGSVAKRDLVAEMRGIEDVSWPASGLHSDAAGVHPDQAKEAYDHSVAAGVPTQFDRETGCAIFTSRAHRKKYLRAVGLHDRNGGYGDP